ncbi:hypothetical protein G3U99_19415 [Vibrio coralliilyticus OCN008]|uniref:hypothetical protein n=1 Tax=Vibrio coralliilyticus TaxID=190893 RepID=UPI0003911FCA|nr:hypothetical protein [Vibrio coralliilyticus]ERB65727.1 hypothetical protein N779_08530 [Vibrio coralliilyticus OCN008]QIJ86434.1 hypothetical protein G3U99_19415 [Vibrio coralliilyticus OCN008]
MAYLPFYITPEEFTELEDKYESEIREEEGSICWTSYNIDEEDRWLRKKHWFYPAALVSLLFIGVGIYVDIEMWKRMEGLALATMVGLFLGGFATYISFAVDDRFDYVLSSRGIVIKQQFGEPAWVPAAVKAMGVIGSIGCILLVIAIGPVALVGLGGFMLVSFTLLNRKPHDINREVILSEQFMCSRYNRERGAICIFSRSDVCAPSTKHDDSVFRVLSKSWLYIFPDNDDRFEKVLRLLKDDLNLECLESNDKSVLFDWKKAPQEFKAFRHQREHYSMEDAVAKRDHPAPPPKKPR